MKSLYESLLTGNVRKPSAKVQPDSKKELVQIIDEHIKEIKPNSGDEVDLNWIDISGVDNLSELFANTNYIPIINTWKIDHVKNFRNMFFRNRYITRSPLPVLQKKLLKNECYGRMFDGCSALKVAPELPAKELKQNCYYSMFNGCTSLKVAPELPATKLEPYCYYSMFNGCTSLKVAPELPATELTEGCYEFMFNNCKSLKNKVNTPFDKPIDALYAFGMYDHCPCKNK